MESEVAEAVDRALIDAGKRLRPEQRLERFLFYNQLAVELGVADRNVRSARQQSRKKLGENK
jgi:hypothetical protein